MLARHVSDLTGPSSGAFYKLYLQTLVCGNTRTARHVQPLRSCRKKAVLPTAFYKLYLQTLVCGNTRTAGHVQPLPSCRNNIHGPYNIKLYDCRKSN